MHRQAEVERRLQGAETARLTAQADALATRGREGARVERADSRSRTLAASIHGAAFNPSRHPKANLHPNPNPNPNPNQLSGGRAYAGRGRPSPASSDCERARRRRSAFSAESAARGSVGPTRRRRTMSAWLAYSASTSCATSSACPRCRPPSSERSRRASCAPSPTSPAPPPPANHHPRASWPPCSRSPARPLPVGIRRYERECETRRLFSAECVAHWRSRTPARSVWILDISNTFSKTVSVF